MIKELRLAASCTLGRSSPGNRRHHRFVRRSRIIAVVALAAPLLSACLGDDGASFRQALQVYLDANRQCFELADNIGLPKDQRLSGDTVRYETTVPGYDGDRLRNSLRKLQEQKLIAIESLDSRPASTHLVPPLRFSVAVRVAEPVTQFLDAAGRSVCRPAKVKEQLSLGEAFLERGEKHRIGRYRIAQSGPALPTNPAAELVKALGKLANGGKEIDPTLVEVVFRVTGNASVVVSVTPITD